MFNNRQFTFVSLVIAVLALIWLVSRNHHVQLITAGIAVFLFGMYFLEQGFSQLSSEQLKEYLRRFTNTIPRSLSLGVITTALAQSSSLISLLTISFLSAGLLSLKAGIGIIFGANLGTTTGAWLIAALGLKIKVAAYALPLLVPAIVLISFNQRTIRGCGFVLAGVGFLFLGIDFIKEGFESFSQTIELGKYHFHGWKGLLIFIPIGILITLVLQSSHATLLLTIAALSTGQLSYVNALAVAIGSNLGTTITAILGSIQAHLEGKRLALAHLVFNLITSVVVISLFYPLLTFNNMLADLLQINSGDYTLRLALFHSLFNLLGVLLLVPFVDPLIRFIQWVLPRRKTQDNVIHARYLTKMAGGTSASALESLVRETAHLFHQFQKITARGLVGVPRHAIYSTKPTNEVLRSADNVWPSVKLLYYQRAKTLFGEILTFAATCKEGMSEKDIERIDQLVSVCRTIVEVIRLERNIQHNMSSAILTGARPLRDKYHQLQERLIGLLRGMHHLPKVGDPEDRQRWAEEQKKRLRHDASQDRDDLELLILSNRVDPLVASSLMNDCQTMREIQRLLLRVAKVLLVENRVTDAIPELEANALFFD
ncbi:Na/Pi cotransporter family protein [Dongshaea marina]|uniref:Na/Pi cotransporter family protein n=1 Tax=Dongshaea marina TaxID=2047966 RepID=UPI000D3E3F75|nr:Na/Pi symporter [Dongshaea marina]